MKIVRIFGIVLALHVVMVLVFFQPGCQSTPRPQPDLTAAPAGSGGPAERLDWDDPAFSSVPEERPRAAPTRPTAQAGRTRTVDEAPLSPLPSFSPAPSSTAPREQASSGVYTVQRGDTLSAIAQRHNVSLSALMSINGLNQNSVIRPGQELLVPAGGTTRAAASSTPPSGTTSYTVQRGDSLSVIAQRHGTTVAELRSLNNLSGDVIRVGQTLIVPDRSGGATRSAPAPTSQNSPQRAPAGDGIRHVVQAGETPGGIASKYGVSVDALMSANNMSDPRRMRIGQELIIPGRPAQTASAAAASQPAAQQPRPREASSTSSPAPRPAPRPVQVLPSEEIPDDEFPIIPIIPDNF
jgi:LysM repeat protein